MRERKYRMLNVVDEYTHECLAIRVERRLGSADVIDVLSDLFILRGVPGHVRSDNERAGVRRRGGPGMDHGGGCQDRLHRPGQPAGLFGSGHEPFVRAGFGVGGSWRRVRR
jgi:hypothetical protein